MAMYSSWMFEIMKVAEETVRHLEGIQCSFIRVDKPDENILRGFVTFHNEKNIEDVLNILGSNVRYLSYFHDEGKTVFEHQCKIHENVMFENHSAMGAKDESSQSVKILQAGHKIQKTSQNDEMQQMVCGHSRSDFSQSDKMLQCDQYIEKTNQIDEIQQMACGHSKCSKFVNCNNVTCGNNERILELVDCLSNSFEFKNFDYWALYRKLQLFNNCHAGHNISQD